MDRHKDLLTRTQGTRQRTRNMEEQWPRLASSGKQRSARNQEIETGAGCFKQGTVLEKARRRKEKDKAHGRLKGT